ncbi:hypothetical protein Plano_1189 [Planococcus sp. PAMC 21323]|uniref:VanW family protein n=1 Tax=Planococcus sp. PAMC 21323 TaxID=1526927 RepID=UPI0005861F19|nr:VanW family protein [Planococcus sp. PAMC 21323]AIY05154.1 hypothetical protein Plano_1189 [Planococcus sp. PAMC 21323]
MDNKLFGLTFAAVFGFALIVFGAANAGAYAVDTWIFPTEEFGDNTYIGTNDVSNMEVPAAKMMLAGQMEKWQTEAKLDVVYQDATASYPLETAEILLDQTLSNAKTGSENSYVFGLSLDATREFLASQFPVASFSEPDVATINNKLEQALQDGQTKTKVAISDDSLSLDRTNVAEVVFPAKLTTLDSATVIDALNGIQIAPESQFSFLDFIAELPLTDVSDDELTQIASTIYGAILQTNFAIDERSIGTQLPTLVPAGQEAAINRNLGVDLAFTNPNKSSFTLNVAEKKGSLSAAINGFPFVYEYVIGLTEEKNIDPRLVKQFSAFATSGKKVEEKGLKGKSLTVIRTTINGGDSIDVETISKDFYPPIHRVEVHPLAKTPETVETPEAGDPDFVDANDDGIHDGTPTEPAEGQPGFVDVNGDGVHDAPYKEPVAPKPGESDFVDKNNNGVHDESEADEEPEKKPVYDKGGNLITE